MKIAIIGRTEILYETACQLHASGHEIVCILTAKEAPEYTRGAEDFRQLAEQWRIPYASSARIIDYRDFLAESGADIAVSINYSGVIPEVVTDLFPLGILNAHGGDLPRYRGNACQAWAILNGETRVGLCIHRMIGGELDSGDIIMRDFLAIDIDTKVTAVLDWIVRVTPSLMVDAVNQLASDPNYVLEHQSRAPKDALRCYPRRPEDGRIDWRRSSLEVLRLINACNRPYAGAFCRLDDVRVVIWDAELVDDGEVFCAIPGQVTAIALGHVDVACGSGKLRLKEIEIDGHIIRPTDRITSLRMRLA
jgi:methionyl-tRNA formyltransferase